jgi:aconitate hydratase
MRTVHWNVEKNGYKNRRKKYNRKFFQQKFLERNDNNPETFSFIASPELVTALAIAGKLSFNPETDFITTESGEEVKLDPPFGDELPLKNFIKDKKGFLAPSKKGFKQKLQCRKTANVFNSYNRLISGMEKIFPMHRYF